MKINDCVCKYNFLQGGKKSMFFFVRNNKNENSCRKI